jgi:hypothetical protein
MPKYSLTREERKAWTTCEEDRIALLRDRAPLLAGH